MELEVGPQRGVALLLARRSFAELLNVKVLGRILAYEESGDGMLRD